MFHSRKGLGGGGGAENTGLVNKDCCTRIVVLTVSFLFTQTFFLKTVHCCSAFPGLILIPLSKDSLLLTEDPRHVNC
jgi:hypothetical protein